MSYSRRTSSYGKNSVSIACSIPCAFGSTFGSCFFREFLSLLLVNNGKEIFRCLSRLKTIGKLRIHKKLHQSTQHLEMYITVHCSCNHEEQLARCSIRCAVIHTVRYCNGCQCRCLNRFTLGMRNGTFHSDCRRAHVFTCKNAFLVLSHIDKITALIMKCNHCIDNRCLVSYRCIDCNPFLLK